MDDGAFRENLVELLRGGQAHPSVEQAVEGLAQENRSRRPGRGLHTVYEVLEHIRTAQEDILRYTLDEKWKSPKWPEEYWPADNDELTGERWRQTLSGFTRDLEEVVRLVRDGKRDLTAAIPHGEGRTYLREVLLVADHNAYHAGQIALIRKLLESKRR